MSAIAGILDLSRHNRHDVIDGGETMMGALEKYPADSALCWRDENVFLGCRVQWITPESVHERLPFHDAERELTIAADAIIDNREELFDRLQLGRERRAATGDGELILLAYRKWGRETPRYLIGDFAFIIWDGKEKTLFAARDLFGNRTLYYHRSADRIALSTTIMPLLALPGVKKAVNESWLADFLTIPVMVETPDTYSTVYEGIHQLPPAHYMAVGGGRTDFAQYGTLAQTEELHLKSNGEYEEAFREVFAAAVQSGLRTHRQVGTSLSGGLDSGTIAGFAARSLAGESKPLHTFSYIPAPGFQDWTDRGRAADESPFIRETIRHVGNISEHYLDLPDKSPYSEIDEWLDLLEMPYKFFENSFWIKGVFEQAERQDVGIVLTGARGNQTISWGPVVHYYAQLLRQFRWIHFYRELQLFSQKRGIARSRLLPLIAKQAMPSRAQASLLNDEPEVERLIHPAFAERSQVYAKLREYDESLSGFLRRNSVEARHSQIDNLAIANLRGTKGTKLSLKHRAWERDPTCDPRVVRFCLSVPIGQYVQDGMDRSLIRRATKGILPDKVRLNQRIRGVQGADWVYRMMPAWNGFLAEMKRLCEDVRVAEILNVERIKVVLHTIGDIPRVEYAFDSDVRFLMRSLVVYRFLCQFHQ